MYGDDSSIVCFLCMSIVAFCIIGSVGYFERVILGLSPYEFIGRV